MYDEYLIKRIISASKKKELKWNRRIVNGGKLFVCKYKLDRKKALLLKVFMGDDLPNSFLDIYMTGNIFIKRIDIMECSGLYNLIFNLDYVI